MGIYRSHTRLRHHQRILSFDDKGKFQLISLPLPRGWLRTTNGKTASAVKMVCYMCDAHSTGICCGGCCGDAEDVIRQRQREKLLQSVRKLKGLSRNSHSQVALDPVAVTESARAKLRLKRSLFCGTFGFGTCCVLLWLCLYGAALSTVHFQLLNLYNVG